MKKYLIGAILSAISLAACAQSAEPVKYRLPDGKIINRHQLDSANKAWGSRGFLMKHDERDPNIIAVSPMTDAYLKKQAENRAKLDALVNRPAPDFTLLDLHGKKWNLAALKGKTIVLNFWFTTCPGCIQEMPELNKLVRNYKTKSIVFLAPGLDDAETIKRFLKIHPFDYTLLQKAGKVGDLYQLDAYPTSVVIDSKGIVRFVQVGGENIRQQISNIIEKITNS